MTTLRRRDMLLGLLGLGATAIACSKKKESGESTKGAKASDKESEDEPVKEVVEKPTVVDVLVIGAGMSGLAAAKMLHEAGKKVAVLEGRDRIGGRVFTEYAPGLPRYDYGGSWIHGINDNPIYALVKQLEIKTGKTGKLGSATYDSRGKRLKGSVEERLEASLQSVIKDVKAERKRRKSAGEPDISVRAAFEAEKADLSNDEKLAIEYLVSTTVENEYATDADDLSLFEWDKEGSFEGPDVMFPDGYGAIPRYLAKELDVSLSTRVERIAWTDKDVSVFAGKKRWQANKCLVTIPLGVLKAGDVEFKGPGGKGLPEDMVKTMDHFGLGVLNKLHVEFPTVFWPKDVDLLSYISKEPGRFNEMVSLAPHYGRAVILAFNPGKYGILTESMSDADTLAEFMKVMHLLYGEDVPQPLSAKQTRWMKDPFARGSYSHLRPGAKKSDYKKLATPIDGRIYFAGEHTIAEHAATVHGAYLSGQRAAKEILG